MKFILKSPIIHGLCLVNIIYLLSGCHPKTITVSPSTNLSDSAGYDSVLAKSAGADEYGMKTYMMVFLKSGPNHSQDSAETATIQKAHLENIFRLAREKKLVIAGPFADKGEIRGIFIFNVSSMEEAKALTEADPAVKAGRLIMEIHPWYGPASLVKMDSIQKRLTKKSII